jgi:hypothetical protein
VRQLRQHRLGDDHRAAVTQVLGQRRVVGRDEVPERECAASGADIGGVDVVLEGDGDAVQRTADIAGGAFRVQRVGVRQGPWVHCDDRVQPILVGGNTLQVLFGELARRDPARLQRRLDVGNAGFDDVEVDRGGRRRRRGGSTAAGRNHARAHEPRHTGGQSRHHSTP